MKTALIHIPVPERLRQRAFSLTEVAMALGIVSFALLAVVGLLPVGLKSAKQSREQGGAANTLSAITSSLRSASSSDGVIYSNHLSGENITYRMGGTGTETTYWEGLTLEGREPQENESRRLCAVLEIRRHPTVEGRPGEALVSVAWSAMSSPRWSGGSWSRADGSLTVGVQFLPR